MPKRSGEASGAIVLVLAASLSGLAQPAPGRVTGFVSGPSGVRLPGVVLSLSSAGGISVVEVSDAEGQFVFDAVAPGTWVLIASLPGYQDFASGNLNVESGRVVRVEVALDIARISESVVIREALRDEEETDPAPEQSTFESDELDALPLPTDQFQEALPLVPGVVRDPEGRLSFNGARPSDSMLLVNGSNVTDPVTGDFAVALPLKAIETVEVNSLPYSAEYGRVTGAVARVETRGGTDEFDVDYGDFWPRPNFRNGTIQGLRSWVPQVRVSGPIKKGKAWFAQGVAYRFVRSRVFDVEQGNDERILESFDSFTQLDFRLADEHHITTTFSYFPVEVENLGLTSLVTSQASPDFHSGGWNAAFSERSSFSRTVVETMVAMKSYNLSVQPKSDMPSRLVPDGLRDNYFNRIDRDSLRFDMGSTITHALPERFGRHVLKLGGDIALTRFSGIDAGLPINVLDGDGRRIRRIEWEGDPSVEGSDLQVSGFVQDRWQPTERIGLEVGLRYDYDRLVAEHQFAPRFSGAIAVDEQGRTVIKAGYGVFYNHVFLHADGFEDLQSRVETTFDIDGATAERIVFHPRVSRQDLEAPRSTTWNAELDQILGAGLQLRVSYRERRSSKEMIVDRVEPDPGQPSATGAMLLSSRGSSFTRELDVTLRFQRGDNELFASYVRSRTTGDLNYLNTLYQNLRSPLFLANESSLFQLDVPSRVLFWGVWKLPADVIVSPGVEWRYGFPYTIFNEDYTPDGERHRGGRFPDFLSIDVRVTKGITVIGHRVRVGFQIFNLGSHFNPRDVINNLGSSRYGEFLNAVDMGISLRLSLGI